MKALVTGFTESLWYEERKRGVYVMSLCPGLTVTLFHTRAGGREDQLPPWFSQTPEQVVQLALKHLARRKDPLVMSGPQKSLAILAQILPRKWVTLLSGKVLEIGLDGLKELLLGANRSGNCPSFDDLASS